MKPLLVLLGIAVAAVVAVTFRAPASPHAQPNAALDSVLSSRDWIGRPPTAGDIADKVVVLDVFTVDCYNCRNVVPLLRALYASERARGLRVIGIHSPETPAERGRAYVRQSLAQQGITWPVAVDNSFKLWNSYGVNAWPTQLFFDRRGRWRKTIVGDSQDADVRAEVASLLAEK